MCRWLAYSGSPVLIEDLLYKPKHSLIDQSLHSTMGAETTNGDGFGVGWYGELPREEYARFLKDMERRLGQVKSRVQELEKLERSATGGNRPGTGVTRTQGAGVRDNSRVIGPLLPPAEFQKSYRDFTEELSRIKAQEK